MTSSNPRSGKLKNRAVGRSENIVGQVIILLKEKVVLLFMSECGGGIAPSAPPFPAALKKEK